MADDQTQTEAERRAALRQAIAERDQARDIAIKANEAHERSVKNYEHTRSVLNGFETLDAEIEEHTISALRHGEPAGLSDALAERVTARERAKIDFIAADNAVTVLRGELTETIVNAEQADAVMKQALHAATLPERQRLRELGRQMQAKGAATVQVAGWSDSAEPWRGICDALLTDPENAAITIDDAAIPDEPVTVEPPRPPVFLPSDGMITVMHPDRPPERITQAEQARREREARIKASSDAMTEALAIEEAKMRVRRLTG
jgi:hypothetical protein